MKLMGENLNKNKTFEGVTKGHSSMLMGKTFNRENNLKNYSKPYKNYNPSSICQRKKTHTHLCRNNKTTIHTKETKTKSKREDAKKNTKMKSTQSRALNICRRVRK